MYWGGIRKLSKDGKTVCAQSLGYCNNPDSHNYHKTTTPETGPMKKWRKWEQLANKANLFEAWGCSKLEFPSKQFSLLFGSNTISPRTQSF